MKSSPRSDAIGETSDFVAKRNAFNKRFINKQREQNSFIRKTKRVGLILWTMVKFNMQLASLQSVKNMKVILLTEIKIKNYTVVERCWKNNGLFRVSQLVFVIGFAWERLCAYWDIENDRMEFETR